MKINNDELGKKRATELESELLRIQMQIMPVKSQLGEGEKMFEKRDKSNPPKITMRGRRRSKDS